MHRYYQRSHYCTSSHVSGCCMEGQYRCNLLARDKDMQATGEHESYQPRLPHAKASNLARSWIYGISKISIWQKIIYPKRITISIAL